MKLSRGWMAAGIILAAVAQLRGAALEILPPDLRGATQPQIALAANGPAYVTFARTGSVYCVTSVDGGQSFSPPVKLGSLPKLALGMRRGPRVAVTESGAVVSAISHADGNLVAWTSQDKGRTWSSSTRVNSVTNSAREGMHAMAGDGKGMVHLAWLDLRNGKTELWLAASTDGGATWGENKSIYKSPDGHICECCHPSLTVDSRGRLWAMWRNWLGGARDMYFSVSEDQGKTFSAARKLGLGTWPLKGCPMDGGHLAVEDGERLRTVWRRDKAIFAASESGEELLAGQGLHPVMAIGLGKTHYLWQSGSKLMLKSGSAEPVVFAAKAAFPAIASASASNAPIVVWEATSNGMKTILAQKL